MKYWSVTANTDAIVITCKGHDKQGTVGAACAEFKTLANKRDKFLIVADLSEMTGYETESRVAWQETFFPLRGKITGLTLVGARSTFVRMGATMVGLAIGVPVRIIATMSELEERYRKSV